MSIDPALLKILVCPEDKSPLHLAEDRVIVDLNSRIDRGELKNRAGRAVSEKIDAGLIRADGKYLYPIRNQIPIMLIDEAIAL